MLDKDFSASSLFWSWGSVRGQGREPIKGELSHKFPPQGTTY